MKSFFIFILFLTSCTSGPKSDSNHGEDRPPRFVAYRNLRNASVDQLKAESFSEVPLERWRKHSLALLLSQAQPELSCPHWEDLAADFQYPLHKLAQIRWDTFCSKDTKNALDLSQDENIIYEELVVDRALLESEKTPALDDDVNALMAKARLATHFQDRESLFKLAEEKARISKNSELRMAAMAALYKNSPRLNPNPKPTDLMGVASDFRLWREFDPALKIYRGIVKSKTATADEKMAALKAIRQTLKTAERRDEYIEATSRIALWTHQEWKKNSQDFLAQKRLYDAQLLLARTLWTEDRRDEALKTLKRTERWLLPHSPMDELNFIRARIFEEQKDFEKAMVYLGRAINEKNPQKNLRDKLLWAQAWLYYKNEQYEASLSPLKEISEKSTDNPEKVKALYWQGRSHLKLSQTTEAKEVFQRLMKEDPLGYYGLLASRELNEKLQPIKLDNGVEKDQRLTFGSLPSELLPLANLTDWLVAVGETSLAEKALNRLSEQLRRLNQTNEETWLRVFSSYAQSGSYLPLFAMLTQMKSEVREGILKSHPEFLFPQPYKEIVEKGAAQAAVPSALVYSIMRQESAFNPKARSPVDAYGLMQLMPSIAKARAKQNKISLARPTDLFDPNINVQLGSYELQALLEKYDQEYILAISAYNASAKALQGWLKFRYRLDPLEFIEEIPYEETRGYVKLVLRNYVFYLRFNSSEAFVFPESCLKLSQNGKAPSQTETH